jgi:[FeFe] hydrogenase H-cluster maturation GTPase HydF
LGSHRIERAKKIFDRADIAVLIVEADKWTDFETEICKSLSSKNIPFVIAVTKSDLIMPSDAFLLELESYSKHIIICSATDLFNRDRYIEQFKQHVLQIAPKSALHEPPLLGDIIRKGSLVVLIIPIDSEAPKGRIILPQVQTIRDILDNDSFCVVVKETDYKDSLAALGRKPDLVVCDSQVVDLMVRDTPEDVPCTTFSILFSRFKGDLVAEARGVGAIASLQPEDKVLLAEACSHHPNQDDIGRVKIPRWLNEFMGRDVQLDISAGRDYPDNIEDYRAIIHCGGCMLTRNEKLNRISKAQEHGVPITNYGVIISLMHGVIERVLQPFPEALEAFISEKNNITR